MVYNTETVIMWQCNFVEIIEISKILGSPINILLNHFFTLCIFEPRQRKTNYCR